MKAYSYTITYGVSRGRDTYGYNIVSVRDSHGKRVATCNGGGYDMIGTVLADTIAKQWPERLLAVARERSRGIVGDGGQRRDREGRDSLYGLTYIEAAAFKARDPERCYIDGACGDSSVERVAKAMGLHVQWHYSSSRRRTTRIGFTIIDQAEETVKVSAGE